jgi:hypothetical protein
MGDKTQGAKKYRQYVEISVLVSCCFFDSTNTIIITQGQVARWINNLIKVVLDVS